MSEQPDQEYQSRWVELHVRTKRGTLIGLIPDYRGPIPREGNNNPPAAGRPFRAQSGPS